MKNLINQTIENKLVEDIKKLKSITQKIRQKQDIGADAIKVIISSLGILDFTLSSSSIVTILITITPTNEFLSVWNSLVTLEANNTGSAVKHWPEQSDDSTHNLGSVIRFEGGKDLANSSDVTGVRAAVFFIENNDNHTLDFIFSARWYGNQQAIT